MCSACDHIFVLKVSDEEEDDAVQDSDITGLPANTSQTQEELVDSSQLYRCVASFKSIDM